MSDVAFAFGFAFACGTVTGFALGFLVAKRWHRTAVGRERSEPQATMPVEPAPTPLLEQILGKDDQLDDLRQNLRVKLLYDETKVEQSIARERERTPQASEEELLQAAIFRWERENR